MWIWSWVLAFVGAGGIYVVGKKKTYGWYVLMISEMLWTIYAVTTHQYGFLLAVTLYSAAYIKSYLRWKEDDDDSRKP